MTGQERTMDGRLVSEGEERWEAARRIASDDHPKDCPCLRDHLENAFLLGMVEGEERRAAALAEHEAEVARLREALRDVLLLIDHVGLGDTSNGVTDPTGTMDEGDFRAADIMLRARAALSGG